MVPTIYLVTDYRTVPDSETGGYACVSKTTQHQTRTAADARYYEALAAAARNTTYPSMGASMITNFGANLGHKCYELEQPEQQ